MYRDSRETLLKMTATPSSIEQLAINTIRTLSMDGVQAANSGHPGTPMALAPVAYQLWTANLRYDPNDPLWPNRDRFVLSCGHASMLIYSLLHLAGVKQVDHHGHLDRSKLAIPIDQIKQFRQLGSCCAGHPESCEAAGIETTTGPLGQGVANSVGMAIASRHLGARYNQPGQTLFDYRVYALCGDGDLMEGVASEATSIAGHLKLSNLCWIYDDNGITIEGHTDLAFSEDVARRFEGMGWQTLRVTDANDRQALQKALDTFHKTTDKPTLILVRSVIGYGSPNKSNTHGAHGAPLGEDEVKLTKAFYGWPEQEKFLVPEGVREHFAETLGARGAKASSQWHTTLEAFRKQHPQQASELEAILSGKLPAGWDAGLQPFEASDKGLATRVSSGKVLNALAKHYPALVGGSADLAPSTMTLLDGQSGMSATNPAGRNMHFGIREHGMAAALNGMALSGLRPFGATFFVFTDYLRPSMRLSSLMRLPVLYILTHDSIGLGEDGPTHQPVEHLAACRAIPGLDVYRPADANEVLECYRTLIGRLRRPAAVVLSRQNVPTLDRSHYAPAAGAARGGYVVSDCQGTPQVILMGTGSELSLCLEAQKTLQAKGIATRVVSMPCWSVFEEQDAAYRQSVLPPAVKNRVACEAGVVQGWERYLGERGRFVGMSSFGASGPYQKLYEHFQITSAKIVAEAESLIHHLA
jgi:transketolase